MNVVTYRAFISIEKRKALVPTLELVCNIPGTMNLGEAICHVRQLTELHLTENFLSKSLNTPEDTSDAKKPTGFIQTYIDVDIEPFETGETLMKEISEVEMNRLKAGIDTRDNTIEWLKHDKVVSFTLTQPKFINKVEELAKKFPNDVKILYRNADGSVYGKMPRRALHIFMNETRELSDEEKEAARQRFAKAREAKNKTV